MSAWWESSGDGWDSKAAESTDDKWKGNDDSWADAGDSWKASGNSWEADAKQADGNSWEADAKQAEDKQDWKANGGWEADTPAPADPWGAAAASQESSAPASASNDNWGNWDNNAGGGEQTWTQPAPSGKHFWETQEYNKQSNILSRKEEWELEQGDNEYFSNHQGSRQGIDFERYNNVPVDVSGDRASAIPVMQTFEEIYVEFGEMIPESLMDNVRKCGYTAPTPVQKYAIPVGLCGRDIMCCAQTGSGKTAAFLFPIIGRMMKIHESPTGMLNEPFQGKCAPDTLIMTPTRELCIQIHEEAQKFCHRTLYRCSRVYGGEQSKIQMEDLAKGCDLMVACPGRLKDFLERDIVTVEKVYILVLDEGDRMLDMGFEKDIREIVEKHGMAPNDQRQTMMFSATFPETCQQMAQDFLYEYIWIGCGIVGGATESVSQSLWQVNPASKYEKCIEALDEFFRIREKGERCLVFVNAKDTAKWLDEQLYAKQFDTGALHGNLDQHEREKNLSRFRSGDIDVMVATDVAARGLDIHNVSMVLNFDMPQDVDTYVHRIGRSGRIGNRGRAVTFISTDEAGQSLENIELLKKIHQIMRDAKSEIPDWMDSFIDSNASTDNGSGAWSKWGGKDMRSDWDNTWKN